jgi:DNA-directed RNA polymerase specialized sigma24 family protein
LTTATELERAILRFGDDLYRLALLLAPDTTAAARALRRAIRQLAVTGDSPTEEAMIAALVAALPSARERRLRHPPPAWAHPPAAIADRAPLLKALARLPRPQRMALGLTILRAFEPDQAAVLFDGNAATVRSLVRDALLALAPVATPDLALERLDSSAAPEACQPTRAALALADPRLHHDAALRGHLALCAACRSADQGWQTLTTQVEQALRGALREVRMPAALADQLQAATQLEQATSARALLADGRVRIALVALPVLALIALLVWPRGAPPSSTNGPTAASPQAQEPRVLVQQARAQLYAPPQGDGVWHGRYEIQWTFADNSYALINADEWIEPAKGRHRAQLVHHQGGGPYEFELADGVSSAWYAVSPNYLASLYPLSADPSASHVQLQATPEQQRQMFDARLASGAWGLAGAYLRQAQTAELRAWGRQRTADGALLDLISFNGVSPLALPPDAPGATTSQVTVLLAVDVASGRLREVRELLGPSGGEQTTRTTWRQVADEWISDDSARNGVFDLRQAWNGTGAFATPVDLGDPTLPLVQPRAITSLAVGVHLARIGLWMPATPPPGATSAVLINQSPLPVTPNQYRPGQKLTFVYLGAGRRLELTTTPGDSSAPMANGEVRTLNGQRVILLPSSVQGYQAQITHTIPAGNEVYTTQLVAFGYTRAEFLSVLQTLGPPSLEAYRAQAQLFENPRPYDAAAFAALLEALKPAPPGGARHFVEQVFRRQNNIPDPLPDPYHQPLYGGWPEQLIQDNWSRGDDASGTSEHAASTRGSDGTIYGQQYLSAAQVWYYDARASRVTLLPGRFLSPDQWNNEDQNTILRMIACGGAQLQTGSDGTQKVVLIETNWRDDSCQNPSYPYLFQCQTSNAPDCDGTNQAPYLADLQEAQISTIVEFGADRRAARIQVWAGVPESGGKLLESWERVSDEQVPTERVPASAFVTQPPQAILQFQSIEIDPRPRPAPRFVTITDALDLAQTPLFVLPSGPILPGTGAITSSHELTSSNLPLNLLPLLSQITAGAPPGAPGAHYYSNGDTIFDRALKDGYAIRFSYTISSANGIQILKLYQGSANALGAYLRASSRWTSSAPIALQIGGQQVNGWQVVAGQNGPIWILFEVDRTLLALEYPSPEMLAALRQLRPLAPT